MNSTPQGNTTDALTGLLAQAYADPKPAPPVVDLLAQQAEWDAQDAARHNQAAPSMAAKHLEALGFPRENWQPEWGPRIPSGCAGRLREYSDGLRECYDRREGLFLGAGLGAGKTSMFALIALRAREIGLTCGYVLAGWELVEACSEERHPWGETHILFLDDLDYVSMAGYEGEARSWDTIGRYLYRHYVSGGVVCVASNLGFADLCKKPGLSRVVSRWDTTLPRRWRLETNAGDQRKTA